MGAVNVLPPNIDEPGVADDLYIQAKRPKQDRRSRLMRSYAAAGGRVGGALIVNACPWREAEDGCKDEDLDAEGYCKHLVGFTLTDDQTKFYPLVAREGRLKEFRFVDSTKLQLVEEHDELVKITTCCRVYRRSGQLTPAKKSKKETE